MAEELDEFGIPIKKKPVNNGEVDEFGIPLKKKVQSNPSSSGVATVGTTSASPLGFAQGANQQIANQQQAPFDFARQSNPDLTQEVDSQRLNQNLAQQSRLREIGQTYDQAQGAGTTEAIRQAADTQSQPIQETGGILTNLAKGSATALEGIAKIPRFVYGVAAAPQNFISDTFDIPSIKATYDGFLANTNPNTAVMRQSPLSMLDDIGEYYRETGEDLGKQTKKYDTGIAESIGKGEFKKAGEQILDQIVETIPSVAVMAMTGGAGNAAKAGQVTKTMANALPFMSQRNAELQNDTSVPEWLKPVNASLNGLAEVVMDQKFGTQAAIQGIVNRFTGEGREAAVDAAKDFVSSYVNKAINGGAKYVKPFVNGAIEEASTQLAQNIVDKYTVNPDIDVMQGVADAAIVGSAMTGGISTVGNIIQPKAKSRLQELETAQKEAIAAVNNPEVSEQAKEGLNTVLEANNKEIETIQKEVSELVSKLSPEQKTQADGLSTQIDQLDAVINDPAVPEEVKTSVEAQRKNVETELVNVLTAVPAKETVEATIVPEPTQTTEVVNETITEPINEDEQVVPIEETVVEETVPTPEAVTTPTVEETVDASEPILKKAEDDLTALKQVENKVKKYQASVKRLNDAFRAGTITEQQFNDTKDRFDDVIAESSPNVPKVTNLTKEETVELDNELKNENLTTNDFIEYERTRAIEDINNVEEAVQSAGNDTGTSAAEATASDKKQEQENNNISGDQNIGSTDRSIQEATTEQKVKAIQDKRQSIKDRIAQKLKEQRGNLSSGFDPSLISDFVDLGATYVEEGIVNAKDFIKRFREDYRDLGFDDSTITDADIENEVLRPNQTPSEKRATTIKNADIDQKRAELGLEERTAPNKVSNQETLKDAKAKIKEGFEIDDLIDDILLKGKDANATEITILSQYQRVKEQELLDIGDEIVEATKEGKGTSLDRLIEKRDQIVADIDRAYTAGERSGTITARALQARKIAVMNDYSLANMLIQKRKANAGEALTTEQISEVTQKYNEIEALNKELTQKMERLVVENEKLKSDNAMKGLKRVLDYEKRKTGRVEQREAIDKNIASALDSLSKKLKEKSGTLSMNAIPVDLIPDIAKLAKLYAQKGINSVEGIVDEMYVNLQDQIDGLTKDDLRDVLVNYDYEAEAREKARLDAFKNRTEKKVNELRDRITQGDFGKRKMEPIKLDAEGQELQDKLRKARYDWEYALELDALKRRTWLEKARDITTEILNTPRALMASVDYSAPLRQGLVLGVNNPKQAGEAFVEMFKQSWSQQRFDRWIADLKESPQYAVMQKAGLYIADSNKPNLAAKEEAFMSNLAEKIPFLGRAIKLPFTDKKIGGLIKGSERAYVSYLNKLRSDVFSKVAVEFENEGKTIENSPKLYEALATYINSATGRGDLGKLENSAQILNSAFFSPRLIASRVRLLTNWANPVWYANTPAPVRKMYAKDMVRLIGAGATLLALAGLAGADVEDDPRSSDFGKIRIGDTRWDIWGGFQQFVRFFSQLATGQRKNTRDKTIREIDGSGFGGESRADLVINMIRSKMAPVPALAWNMAAGKNMVGEEFTYKNIPESFYPLLVADVVKAVNEEGGSALLTRGVPGAFGVGVQSYGGGTKEKPMTEAELRKKLKEERNKKKE